MNVLKKLIFLSLVGVLATACAPLPQAELKPLDAQGMTVGDTYAPKVTNFQVILDASLSMDENRNHFVTARDIASRINQGIPTDIDYNAGLRSFGHSSFQAKEPTTLLYGMTRYDRDDFHYGLNRIKHVGGTSPLDLALKDAGDDLKPLSGKSAIIVISDGLDMDKAPAAAKDVKAALGDNLCIYTIAVGNERNGMGHEVLQQVADAGGCGYATSAADLGDAGKMAAFIHDVFLTKPAPAPKPKPAPAGPVDSDGDGVYDKDDKCPATPAGVRVDSQGCPTVMSLYINFATDSSAIAANYNDDLAKAARCINDYPGHQVVISGHTDSTGSEAYNQKLSERRAQAVVDHLARDFKVAKSKMIVHGYGETMPIADNKTKEGRAQNRRVDVACGIDGQ